MKAKVIYATDELVTRPDEGVVEDVPGYGKMKDQRSRGPLSIGQALTDFLAADGVREVHAIGQSECMDGTPRHTTVTVIYE
jgi:hypothetical protein